MTWSLPQKYKGSLPYVTPQWKVLEIDMQLPSKKWPILILFVILCTAALVMEWARLLNEAMAEQEALRKCGEWQTWFGNFFSAHSCVYTHTHLMASSFLRINPVLVLTVLPARLLFAPVEVLSATLGKGFVAFNHQLPFIWQLLVFLSTFALLVIVILFKCGYRIRLLGGFLDVTPVTSHRQQYHAHNGLIPTNAQPGELKRTRNETECAREEMVIKRGQKQPSTSRIMPALNPHRESGGVTHPNKILVLGSRKKTYLGNVKNEQVRIYKKS